jgi:hypothetical protein
MKELYHHILDQLKHNSGKNIFSKPDISKLEFIQSTSDILSNYKLSNMDKKSENDLIKFTIKNTLDQFYKTNQFYSFDQESIQELREIYKNLFSDLKKISEKTDYKELSVVSDNHYITLKNWIKKSNAFAEKIYTDKYAYLKQDVVCSEYSPEIQIELLGIELENIIEPVLDIGCGKNANLVNHFHNLGYAVFGIDRSVGNSSILQNTSWLEYDFKPETWGTLISNLGFSNHFNHHHLREDGSYIDYAKKYMEILNSLKIGGSFYYAPGVPFIEKFLNNNLFNVEYKSIHETDFNAIHIKRLK